MPDRRAWDSACSFMQKTATQRLDEIKKQLSDDRGPGWWSKWVYWQAPTADNHYCCAVQDELNNIIKTDPVYFISVRLFLFFRTTNNR